LLGQGGEEQADYAIVYGLGRSIVLVDDEAPKKKRVLEFGADLSALSIEELRAHLAALEAEALRVKAQIEAKQSSRSAADAFFKR
jgi:uncharacterized small protein (DUF1192 family)